MFVFVELNAHDWYLMKAHIMDMSHGALRQKKQQFRSKKDYLWIFFVFNGENIVYFVSANEPSIICIY